ncbi:MAG: hypothetical protein E6772_16820 [Dysgonomonas sp.]|nr:hypothetical protein [Dysgonomonas sp.]
MNRKDIRIVRMECASIISSAQNFISYNYKAGEENKPILCIMTFDPTESILNDLKSSKIINAEIRLGYKKINYPLSMLTLTPLFGFTNQKLEDIFFELFEKYNL